MDPEEIRKKMTPLCLCPQCPTFVSCGEEITFCLAESGKSKCIKNRKGCLCGGCPVEKQMGFQHMYYCVFGPDKDQY